MTGFGFSDRARSYAVSHVHVIALYEPVTGEILHLHVITTVEGAKPPAEAEAVDEARTRARRWLPNVSDLAAVVSTDRAHAERPHRIDPDRRAFIALPLEHDDRLPTKSS